MESKLEAWEAPLELRAQRLARELQHGAQVRITLQETAEIMADYGDSTIVVASALPTTRAGISFSGHVLQCSPDYIYLGREKAEAEQLDEHHGIYAVHIPYLAMHSVVYLPPKVRDS